MNKRLYPAAAACFLVLMCLYPADALQACAQSLAAWAGSVVPSLLPYLIIAPALTTPQTAALLSRFLTGLLRLLRLPAASTGALLIGLLSGSPSGAAALACCAPDDAAPPGATLRAALLASGASPAFLLTGIAVSLLDRPETGWLLLRSQLFAALLSGLMLRNFGSDRPASSPPRSHATEPPVLRACLTLLTVGGYMALFSVLARLLARTLGSAWETPLLCALELAGGCRALASLTAPLEYRLPLISATACFGGISVYAQCMSFLRPLGVDPLEYAVGKLVQSALCALITYIQLACPANALDPSLTGFLLLCALLVCVMLYAQRKNRLT